MKWLAFIALFFALAGLRAASGATLTALTAPDRPWISLSLADLPVGTVEISVQDARGGVSISRRIAAVESPVILALPLVSPAELSNSQWPIIFTARDAAGRPIETGTLTGVLKSLSGFRIALPQGAAPEAAAHLWPTALPLEWIELPPEEIAAAPAQAFAGFDAIYIPAPLAQRIDESRVLALLGAGAQVVVGTDARPLPLSQLLWKRLDSKADAAATAARPAWLCASSISTPLPLINPDLAQLHLAQSPVPPGVTTPLLLFGPIALFLAIAVRVLFRRVLVAFGFMAVALVALAAVTIFILRHADLTRSSAAVAQWHTLRANESTASGGIDTETILTPCATLFGQEFGFYGSRVLPLIATPRAWWQLKTAELRLGAAASEFHISLAPRQQLLLQVQEFHAAPLVPAFPGTLDERRRLLEQACPAAATRIWIVGGYAFPAAADAFDAGGTPFSSWSREQTNDRSSLDAWYTLQFRSGSRYLLWLDAGEPHMIEFPQP